MSDITPPVAALPASAGPNGLENLPFRRKMAIYVAVLVGMFIATLDMQIVATALPTIVDDLGRLDLFGWVGAAYLLANAAATPFYGKLGDLFGRKRVLIAAIALFALGSLASGFAWSMESLIAARTLQGLGGGGLMTSAFAIMADLFEPRERARYQGFGAAVFTVSSLIGPVAGGILSETLGWQFIFLVNLPTALALVVVLALVMPARASSERASIDFLGGLLLAGSVVATVFWAETVTTGAGGPMAWLLPFVAAAGFFCFVLVQRRAADPIVPLHLLTDRTIALALVISLISGVSTMGMLNYFALFLQTVTGLSPAMAGLFFVPSAIGSLVATSSSGVIMARTGRYKMLPVGAMVLGMLVMFAFTTVDARTPAWLIGLLMFLFAASIGFHMQALIAAIQSAAPRRDVGAATGSLTLSRTIGASLGLAANGGILTSGLIAAEARLTPETLAALPGALGDMTPAGIAELPVAAGAEVVSAFAGAFDGLFLMGAGLFGVALVAALLMPDRELDEHRAAPAASLEK